MDYFILHRDLVSNVLTQSFSSQVSARDFSWRRKTLCILVLYSGSDGTVSAVNANSEEKPENLSKKGFESLPDFKDGAVSRIWESRKFPALCCQNQVAVQKSRLVKLMMVLSKVENRVSRTHRRRQRTWYRSTVNIRQISSNCLNTLMWIPGTRKLGLKLETLIRCLPSGRLQLEWAIESIVKDPNLQVWFCTWSPSQAFWPLFLSLGQQ